MNEITGKSQITLPDIAISRRIIPNDMIRSSLFTISNHNQKRDVLKRQVLYSFSNTEITYTGEELRQDDEDLWLQLIYLASVDKSTTVNCRPYTLIAQLGWPQRPQYKKRLENSLARMSATDLAIKNKAFEKAINLSLVRKFYSNEGSEWKIMLEPEVIKLFGNIGETYSKIHWEQRKKLGPLAKWLHSFYSSHADPAPILVSRIMKLSGSKTKSHRHFKPLLRRALFELTKIGF